MRGKDAIPNKDVSPQQADGGADVLSPRELAMLEIEEQLNQHAVSAPPETETETQPIVTEPVLPEILADDQFDKLRVKVKVDGEVVELPLSEVTRGYQKDATASRRLSKAAEERKGLEAREQQLEERERQFAAAKAPPSPEADGDVDGQIKAAMSALVEGDEEAAANALKSILKGRQGTATPQMIDEEALLDKAERRIEAKRQSEENEKAWSEFTGTSPAFADETSKERQYGDYLFNTKYSPQIQSGAISYREALVQAADEVTAVFQPQPAAPAAPGSSRQQKEQRKAAIDNLPVAGARAVRQPEAVQTLADVLDEMRESRGQPV
jgi:hypothetical protein